MDTNSPDRSLVFHWGHLRPRRLAFYATIGKIKDIVWNILISWCCFLSFYKLYFSLQPLHGKWHVVDFVSFQILFYLLFHCLSFSFFLGQSLSLRTRFYFPNIGLLDSGSGASLCFMLKHRMQIASDGGAQAGAGRLPFSKPRLQIRAWFLASARLPVWNRVRKSHAVMDDLRSLSQRPEPEPRFRKRPYLYTIMSMPQCMPHCKNGGDKFNILGVLPQDHTKKCHQCKILIVYTNGCEIELL